MATVWAAWRGGGRRGRGADDSAVVQVACAARARSSNGVGSGAAGAGAAQQPRALRGTDARRKPAAADPLAARASAG